MSAATADETDVAVLKALTFSRLALTEKLFIMKQGGPALSLQLSELFKKNNYQCYPKMTISAYLSQITDLNGFSQQAKQVGETTHVLKSFKPNITLI